MGPRLGVNIDHIATLRQLRGTPYPDLLAAAKMVEKAGAHQITVHLREDRRHIQDQDVKQLRSGIRQSLNLEMAATNEMLWIARHFCPNWACLVPEKRQELTTEGGLNLEKNPKHLQKIIAQLQKRSIRVSAFIEPSLKMVKLAKKLGVDAIEIHTGRYAQATQKQNGQDGHESQVKKELARIEAASRFAKDLGLPVHAGHGLDFENVRPLIALKHQVSREALIEEYNIGHALICRAALVGLERAVREMISALHAP